MKTKTDFTWGQIVVLITATLPMVVFGSLGGWGTYTNIASVFDRSATAIGVVAAGEGVTLVLALVMVGLTMLGQPSPTAVRIGLWMLPATASATGAIVAKTFVESVVFAVTPLAMCVSAEGLGLLARRIVVYRTGIDAEVQRKNAEVMQRLAYERARAIGHPRAKERSRSELKAWKLAKRVGTGDSDLGARLVVVQRDRMTDGADTALAAMFTSTDNRTVGQLVSGQDSRTVGQDTEPDSRTIGQLVSGQDTEPDSRTIGQLVSGQDIEPDSRTIGQLVSGQDTEPDSRTIGQDSRTIGQDTEPDSRTIGQDSRTIGQDTEPDSRTIGQDSRTIGQGSHVRHTDKLSVRAYIRDLHTEFPGLSKSDAWDLVLGRYGPDTKLDTFNKSWLRALNDLNLR